MEKVLHMIGLARKAGRAVCGEEACGEAAEGKKIRLLLFASDAAPKTRRRVESFAQRGACLALELPAQKEALGQCVGYGPCAMVGITDMGFAAAIGKMLAQIDEARYGAARDRLDTKAKRAAERKRQQAEWDKSRPVKVKAAAAVEKPAAEKAKEPGRERRVRSAPRKRPGSPERQARFAGSRPVKKGKGSRKK